MVERAAEETSEPEDAAFAHGSLGRLAPAWWEPAEGEPEPEPWLSPDAALDRFLDWTTARGIELWSHQEEALMDLMVGDHVILGTPTGSGKSLVALGMQFMGTPRLSRYSFLARSCSSSVGAVLNFPYRSRMTILSSFFSNPCLISFSQLSSSTK